MGSTRLSFLLWLIFLCILFQVSYAAADLIPTSSCCTYTICAVVGLAGGLAGGGVCMIVVFVVWKCKKTAIVRCIFSAKKATLTENKAQLQKQVQRTQEELDVLAAFLTSVMELKGGLKNQRQKFRQQLEETEREKEENKEKLQLVEKQIAESEKEKATEKTEGYLREKQNLLNAQWKLEKRKEDVEKQQLNLEKLLQNTEAEITRITDRKRKVENHMELINLHLEEVEGQNDTVHLERE